LLNKMVSDEDKAKETLYLNFQENYFSGRSDGKTKVNQLNEEEKKDFYCRQKKYVEEEYQKVKYNIGNKKPGDENGNSSRIQSRFSIKKIWKRK